MKNHGKDFTGDFIQHHETGEALLLGLPDGAEDDAEWVPISQISKIVRSPTSNVITVTMSEWIAKTKGFTD